MSGSMSSLAALFRSPTSSSNSDANTEEGRLMGRRAVCEGSAATSSPGLDASFRCCR
uniref:Uncharacterized protein n=1 Tax=Myripristis murdjan TaxID=586833 RepID=A0A667Z4D1_9TELE